MRTQMTCKMPANATRETFKHLNAKKQRKREGERGRERAGRVGERTRETKRGKGGKNLKQFATFKRPLATLL